MTPILTHIKKKHKCKLLISAIKESKIKEKINLIDALIKLTGEDRTNS